MIPRTDLDVNALSSSQMMCGGFVGAKLRFFEQLVQKFVINCFIGRQGFTVVPTGLIQYSILSCFTSHARKVLMASSRNKGMNGTERSVICCSNSLYMKSSAKSMAAASFFVLP